MNTCLLGRCCTVFLALIAGTATAGPIGSGFTSGAIRAAGFPDPLRQSTYSLVNLKSGNGGGSTGGGFGRGTPLAPLAGMASASIGITDALGLTTVSVNGTANHFISDGFTGAYTQTPIVVELTKSVSFEITNNSGTWSGDWVLTEPVTLEALTGSIITGDSKTGVLTGGTYRISFGVAAGHMNSYEAQHSVSQWYGQFGGNQIYSTEMHWNLKLSDAQQLDIGSSLPETVYYVQGQSFTPATFGNFGAPPYPASTPAIVRLKFFTIDYDLAETPLDKLYIYTSPPTPDEALTGAGSMATGTHIGYGIYQFDNVTLDYRTKYYAVLPQPANIHDGPGDLYEGGVDLFPRLDMDPVRVAEGYGYYDIGFRATFEYIPGCPADINLDGVVDDADFSAFVVGYNALLCSDPAMVLTGCSSNLNSDLVVDDADFVIFVTAYNDLLCP